MLVIFGLSSLQGSTIPSTLADYSVLAHFTEYAILAGLLVFATGWRPPTVGLALALVLACSLWGVTDEFHQHFVPGRTPDPVDWATDTAGAAVSVAALAVVRRRGVRE
jgi:VanZ family protein